MLMFNCICNIVAVMGVVINGTVIADHVIITTITIRKVNQAIKDLNYSQPILFISVRRQHLVTVARLALRPTVSAGVLEVRS